MKLLEGRIALITGAGSGIGRAIALTFADAGVSVAVADLNRNTADRVADEIAAADGQALSLPLDVSQPERVTAAVAETVATWDRLDILVNSAGICPLTALADISLAEWNRVLAVNLTGTFLCSQAAFPHLQASPHGRIINISSLAGRTGGVTVGLHYSTSKGGVISMTKALARMLAPSGGTANCIAPGPLDTPMTADWPPENREMLRQQIPLGRLGRAEDVAATALHLASDAGAFITGATLDVNGGIAML
ncbi:MAG: SDR family oxidoreductase [Anaerolineae bacterium]|nr:SDR family oxidoreductase [Anaerolineae bacterium]